MIVFDGLRDIDDIEVGVMIEDVVFGEIGVDEFTFVVHLANYEEELLVQLGVGRGGYLGLRILESRGSPESMET